MKTPTDWTIEQSANYVLHAAPTEDTRQAFAESIAKGLAREARCFEARFLYDRVGSEIYERITEQVEYYPTRAEAGLLLEHAGNIRERVGQGTFVELGSGSSTKTRHLLDTGFERYVPIDISASALRQAALSLCVAYPDLQIEALATTYDQGLAQVERFEPAMIGFLGSSLGNLTDRETDELLRSVAEALPIGGHLLLGVDLVKSRARLEAAYNDAEGWSRRFTLNMLDRMNRELGTEIPVDSAEHVAFYNEAQDRIEIYAEFLHDVDIDVLGQRFQIRRGERIRTEISRKYRIAQLAKTAARSGFALETSYTDGDVALLLFQRG